LTKQNFNLKLELHHRRERQQALEARLEAAEAQLEEQAETQAINDKLLAELERRDQAVEEAVGIICELEDKIRRLGWANEKLKKEREIVDNFDTNPSYFPSNDEELLSSSPPPRPQDRITRMPSFLSENSEWEKEPKVLRSLFQPNDYGCSDVTLPKQFEEAPKEMDSPRLSVLSESSFLSVYGDKHLSLDNEAPEEPQRMHRKSESVEKWIDERPKSTTPKNNSLRKNQFLSINDVLESPLQRLEKLKHTIEKNSRLASTALPEQTKEKRKSRDILKRVLTDKASFDHGHPLPPTPDTISTSTLRHYQNSTESMGQDHQDANERSFLNSTSTFPDPPINSRNPFQSTLSMRPRSAGETVTSRREGHGWDTETQGDDISSNASTSSGMTMQHPRRVPTPDLFNFSSHSPDDSYGRDLMFSREPQLPAYTAARYDKLRHVSVAEPRSDDTVRQVVRYQSDNVYGTSPLDTSPRPVPPDRRSSMNATHPSKLRKSSRRPSSSTPSGSDAATPTKKEEKKNSMKNRLFGRSETSPEVFTQQQQRPQGNRRSMTSSTQWNREDREEERARATPPPIKRSRGPAAAPLPIPTGRPSSAGAGGYGMGLRRTSAFGGDGPADGAPPAVSATPRKGVEDVGGEKVEEGKSGGGAGKSGWFGFNKIGAGSLRRS
jgi:hypothetical protein